MNSTMVLRSPMLAGGGDMRIVRLYARPQPIQFSKGGLVQAAQKVRAGGRGDDDVLLHITQEEFDHLKKMWGEPEINPNTGLPEYGFLSHLWGKVKGVVKQIAPYVGIIASVFFPALAPAIGGMLGASGAAAGMVGSAILGGAAGAVSGGGKGALAGALTGGLGGSAGQIGGALGATGQTANVLGNAALSGAASKLQGGDFAQGALTGGALSAALPALQQAGSNAKSAIANSSVGSALGMTPTSAPVAALPAEYEMNPSGEMGPPSVLQQVGPNPGGAPTAATATGAAPATATVGPPTPAASTASTSTNLMGLAKKYAPAAALLLAASSTSRPTPAQAPQLPPEFTSHLPQLNFGRTLNPSLQDWYTYGMRPQPSFYAGNTIPAYNPPGQAHGGPVYGHGGALSQSSRFARGPGDGRSDSIPARLSDGEYVLSSEDVSLLGNGSSEAGAKKLDQWRQQLRKHKGGALAQGKISPKAKNPMAYLRGGR